MTTAGRAKDAGFTLIEILIVAAVLAILGTVGLVAYTGYTERARAADIIVKYDAIRSGLGADLVEGALSRCSEVMERMGTANLRDDYARLSYGFEAVTTGSGSGYRPVFTVCARVADYGALGVKVARAAHDTFAHTNTVEGGAVLTDTVVTFAVPLTPRDKVVCRVPTGGPRTACGDPVPVPPTPAVVAPPAPTVVAPPTPTVVEPPKARVPPQPQQGTDRKPPDTGGTPPPSGTPQATGAPATGAPATDTHNVQKAVDACLANCAQLHAPGQRTHCIQQCEGLRTGGVGVGQRH